MAEDTSTPEDTSHPGGQLGEPLTEATNVRAAAAQMGKLRESPGVSLRA